MRFARPSEEEIVIALGKQHLQKKRECCIVLVA
jgi:hypothetical protein